MTKFLSKAFGGLSAHYFWRNLIFGAMMPALIIFMATNGRHPLPIISYVLMAFNTLLYPYSRFVYESVIDFIVGDNVFIVNTLLMLAIKLLTIALCWGLAILIAPLGLTYLYFRSD